MSKTKSEQHQPRLDYAGFMRGCGGIFQMAGGQPATEAEVKAAIASVDQAAVFKEVDADLIVVEWDRKEPINGAPPAKVLVAQRANIPPGGLIYLIKRKSTGQVLFFQPMVPGATGIQPITRANFDEVSAAHRASVVQSIVLSAVKRLALDKLAALPRN